MWDIKFGGICWKYVPLIYYFYTFGSWVFYPSNPHNEKERILLVCFMWSTDLLDYTFLLNRFCRLTLWSSCSHLQFSGFAVSSICWFSMLVFFFLATYLPKQIAIIRELTLGFISLRRAWNTAAIDNGLWQMLYSNLFGNYSTCTSKEQDHKLVPDGKDVVFHGGMGVDPTININWKEAVRRKCEGNGSHVFIIFL